MPLITLGLTADRGADGGESRRDPALGQVFKMLERLGGWAATRADRLADVYLVRAGNSVDLYLITRAEAYDFPLGRELAEFAAPYIARGVINAATLIPASSPEELEAFFNPKSTFRIVFE